MSSYVPNSNSFTNEVAADDPVQWNDFLNLEYLVETDATSLPSASLVGTGGEGAENHPMTSGIQPLAQATSHFTPGGQSAQFFGTSNGHYQSHRLPNNQAVTKHMSSAPSEGLPAEHFTNTASDIANATGSSSLTAVGKIFTENSASPTPAEVPTSASDSDRLSTTATTPGISTATCTCFLCASGCKSGRFRFRHDELCPWDRCGVPNQSGYVYHKCFLGCGEIHGFWYCISDSTYSPYGVAKQHLKSHLTNKQGDWQCKEPGCKSTFRSKFEFLRHSKKHCLKSEKFPCDFPGCDRVGDNGFTRRDKLNDHRRNGHKGMKVMGNQGGHRVLLPKA